MNMKKILFCLALIACTIKGNAQIQHLGDSIIHHSYVNILYTDSSTYRINVPLKMAVNVYDYGDSVLGAQVNVMLYYNNGTSFGQTIGTQFRGIVYENWNASDQGAIYRIVSNDWSVRSIYLTFKP